MNLLYEILTMTNPEDIEGVVLGEYPYSMTINWETYEDIDEPYEVDKFYTFNESKEYLNIDFDELSGNIFNFTIWTIDKIITISINETLSYVYSIPRNPIGN